MKNAGFIYNSKSYWYPSEKTDAISLFLEKEKKNNLIFSFFEKCEKNKKKFEKGRKKFLISFVLFTAIIPKMIAVFETKKGFRIFSILFFSKNLDNKKDNYFNKVYYYHYFEFFK